MKNVVSKMPAHLQDVVSAEMARGRINSMPFKPNSADRHRTSRHSPLHRDVDVH